MYVTWVADRVGNWLFHCHIPEHIAHRGSLGMPPQQMLAQAGQTTGPNSMEMGGLVTAIEVKAAEEDTAAAITTLAPPNPRARHIRMLVRPAASNSPSAPQYDVAFDQLGVEPALQPDRRAGPPLVLTRGEPVNITVVNRLSEPTSVHWHGIELESFYDGVPGVSGIRPMLAPPIAPGDSFEVRFTPPRSGTFLYHTHVDEARQQRGGMAGALIVTPDRNKFDASRDIPVLVSSPTDSATEEHAVLVNGALAPLVVVLRRGVTARLRLANITTLRPALRFELRQDSTLQTWREIAKDGADIPAADRTIRLAQRVVTIGETVDVEFTPTHPGELRLEMHTAQGVLLGILPISVQ
jgi:FtsP/CotA-like multicopper oxidase with cupredoxin domain